MSEQFDLEQAIRIKDLKAHGMTLDAIAKSEGIEVSLVEGILKEYYRRQKEKLDPTEEGLKVLDTYETMLTELTLVIANENAKEKNMDNKKIMECVKMKSDIQQKRINLINMIGKKTVRMTGSLALSVFGVMTLRKLAKENVGSQVEFQILALASKMGYGGERAFAVIDEDMKVIQEVLREVGVEISLNRIAGAVHDLKYHSVGLDWGNKKVIEPHGDEVHGTAKRPRPKVIQILKSHERTGVKTTFHETKEKSKETKQEKLD